MHPSYYYNAHACILVFDVTRKQTYQHLTDWYKELTEFCENIPVIVVANKIDIDPRVTNKKFKFADKHNLKFYFASAADGTNIVQVNPLSLLGYNTSWVINKYSLQSHIFLCAGF